MDQQNGFQRSFVACSGAVTSNVRVNGTPQSGEFESQLDQTPIDDSLPALVTMTIGGNDMGFGDILEFCFKYDCTDPLFTFRTVKDENGNDVDLTVEQFIQRQIPIVKRRLEDLYDEMRTRFGSDSTIVVLGYPQLFPAPNRQDCYKLGWFEGEMEMLRKGTHDFNVQIKAAAKEHGVHFVDLEEPFFDHEVCGGPDDHKSEWINGPGFGAVKGGDSRKQMFHPTRRGQKAMADAVTGFLDQKIHSGWPLNSAGLPMNPDVPA